MVAGENKNEDFGRRVVCQLVSFAVDPGQGKGGRRRAERQRGVRFIRENRCSSSRKTSDRHMMDTFFFIDGAVGACATDHLIEESRGAGGKTDSVESNNLGM